MNDDTDDMEKNFQVKTLCTVCTNIIKTNTPKTEKIYHPQQQKNYYFFGTHEVTHKSTTNDSQCQLIKLRWTDA